MFSTFCCKLNKLRKLKKMKTLSDKSKKARDILKILLRLILLLVILFLTTRTFKKADEKNILFPAESVYSKGNAPDSTREEIIDRLNKFQSGYIKRDINDIDSFMESLYSKENILILGTMPREIFIGYERATELVKADWEHWGDCKFAVDSANISSNGNTAWFSTKGYVTFDLSSLLRIPLRLTGTMVKENQVWKFQQQQFQFDIDFSFNLITTLILSVWVLICFIILAVKSVKILRKH